MLGAGWTSYIMQAALAYMLVEPSYRAQVSRARDVYRHRRELLSRALLQNGISTSNRDGLSLWIPVGNERDALIALAAYGINASPGSRFMLRPYPGQYIRAATSRLDADHEALAAAIASAANLKGPLSGNV